MNTKFYLSGMEIEQPTGINGLYLERKRDNIFHGFIRKKTSTVKGIGDVTIDEEIPCKILKTDFENDSIDAVTEFKIEQDGDVIYEAEFDFGQMTEDDKGFITAGFRDSNGVATFDVGVEKVYEIDPTDSIFLEKTKLTGKATHGIDSALTLINAGLSNPRRIYFSMPMKVSNKDSVSNGTGTDVKDITGVQLPFWSNTDTKPVKVSIGGLISFKAKTSDNTNLNLYLLNRQSGIVKETISVYSFASTVIESSHNAVIVETINIGVGGDVVLFMEGDRDLSSYQITIDSLSMAVEQDYEVKGSDISGVFASNLMSKLVSKASNGEFSFTDNTSVLKDIFVTNGSCLRGIDTTIKASLINVFKGFDKLFNLVLNVNDKTVTVSRKEVNYKSAGVYILPNVENYKATVISDKFVTEIKVGYSEWKSDTLLGNTEYNSTRTYDTKLSKAKGKIDLTISEMIASGKMIEKQRRLRYEILKNNEKTDDKLDDNLFIIETNGTESITGKYGLNESLTPMHQLVNYVTEYGHCREFIYRTGDGSVNDVIGGYLQSDDFKELKGFYTGRKVAIEGSCTLLEYMSFGDRVKIDVNGQVIDVWVENDLYRLQTDSYLVEGFEINTK